MASPWEGGLVDCQEISFVTLVNLTFQGMSGSSWDHRPVFISKLFPFIFSKKNTTVTKTETLKAYIVGAAPL